MDGFRFLLPPLLVTLIVGLGALTVREVLLYRRDRAVISGRHLVIRILSGLLLLGLLTKVLLGLGERFSLAYWSKCAALGYLVCLVAFVDLWLVIRCRRHRDRAGAPEPVPESAEEVER